MSAFQRVIAHYFGHESAYDGEATVNATLLDRKESAWLSEATDLSTVDDPSPSVVDSRADCTSARMPGAREDAPVSGPGLNFKDAA